jgi:chorismate mutase/prephenate dehydratase
MNDVGNLTDLRKQIDAVDEQLVVLLNERARLALEVGIAKGRQTEVYQPTREAAVLQHVVAVNKGPLSGEGIQAIFRNIIEICRTIQYNK